MAVNQEKNEITKKELLDLNMKIDESGFINFFEYNQLTFVTTRHSL